MVFASDVFNSTKRFLFTTPPVPLLLSSFLCLVSIESFQSAYLLLKISFIGGTIFESDSVALYHISTRLYLAPSLPSSMHLDEVSLSTHVPSVASRAPFPWIIQRR